MGASGRAGIARSLVLAAAALAVFLSPTYTHAQCGAEPADSPIHQLFGQHNWSEVVHAAEALPSRSGDVDFDYGMALAHLERWSQARAALLAGRRQCPNQKRFPIELAGVAFQTKNYPEAAAWIRKGLRLDPHDTYAIDFVATTYFLMGNLDAALKYWNRIQKPAITEIHFDPQLRVHRLLLDRAFAFAPASVLSRTEYATTETRLKQLGIFSAFSIGLTARPESKFDADFHAIEQKGFGANWVQALVATLGGVPYQTIYVRYSNMDRDAINFDSLWRWDAQKRRAWLSMSGPLNDLPQWRWEFAADARNENWIIRSSFTGPAPALGSLNLERQTFSATLSSFPAGSLEWALGAEVSHRTFRSVSYGTALTANLVSPGFQLKQVASIRQRLVDLPERRFALTAGASSDFGRLWSDPPRAFEQLQGSMLARWFPQAVGDGYEASQQLRAGHTFGKPPFDELFMLGVERDNDLWLRGLVGTRDGRKGSSPLGSSYVLSNSDFYRRFYSNGLLTVKAGPWLDIGKGFAPNPSLAPRQWLYSAGLEARLTVFGTGVVLTWGRDIRSGSNAFYATLAEK